MDLFQSQLLFMYITGNHSLCNTHLPPEFQKLISINLISLFLFAAFVGTNCYSWFGPWSKNLSNYLGRTCFEGQLLVPQITSACEYV